MADPTLGDFMQYWTGSQPSAGQQEEQRRQQQMMDTQRKFAERRQAITEQLQRAYQNLQSAQVQCSQGNQMACQSIGQMNSETQRLQADLDRLQVEEARALEEMNRNSGSSIYGSTGDSGFGMSLEDRDVTNWRAPRGY